MGCGSLSVTRFWQRSGGGSLGSVPAQARVRIVASRISRERERLEAFMMTENIGFMAGAGALLAVVCPPAAIVR